jgi:hypothetical protein
MLGVLDVHFTSPLPVDGCLGARVSSPLRKQARRLRSQGKVWMTGGVFTKQTSRCSFRVRMKRSAQPLPAGSRAKAGALVIPTNVSASCNTCDIYGLP